uniref:Protein RER1 n=1 Tax=Chromera velia CCMP2878 TaxID=1169474 RepID=A0A0G4FKY3_9ALVE|eukprot:Cvel_17418.t1-p1 / transcript=Cvel_17418.t1 / gene=Cvel_17418 / organism=Chromera_velia_CCMP2878 / gene_product=Protein RER1A, putative / transcript_product=Protein RER1A, putative / location=Cvel_scaffold1388:5677-7852(+) / protein_length=224 / sequence_SO=supercontig / SO=protein_coding / is_pseudo=false
MMASEEIVQASFPVRLANSVERVFSVYVGKTTIYVRTRWSSLAVLLALYVLRVYYLNAFYIVTYGLAIYLLNLFLGFISPQVDPDMDGPVLPTRDAEEYRPFQRRLPEFKFWGHAMKAVLISITMTFFPVFDLPVFWPILLFYFLMLFFLTMKQQIQHMIKHKYIPISFGKQTYGDITRGGKGAASPTRLPTVTAVKQAIGLGGTPGGSGGAGAGPPPKKVAVS